MSISFLKPGSHCKGDFPILANSDLIYLDSAASAQKPKAVIDAEMDFYREHYANVHRGVYRLSAEATELYEDARRQVSTFLNCEFAEVIFTRGTTEGINLVAYSWGRKNLVPGDEILISILEHHSNFVPWQLLAKATGATLRVAPLGPDENFCLNSFEQLLNRKTKLVAVSMLSNAIGVVPPLPEIIRLAKDVGAKVVVDAAQGVVHQSIDTKRLDADFISFSGHKLYGPTGIGVLFGKRELLEEMPPFLSGGDMIESVSVAETSFNSLPYKFEAGTPNVAGAVGLGAAIKYFQCFECAAVKNHEAELIRALYLRLSSIKGLRILAPAGSHHGLISFVVKGIHPHDLCQFLDREKLALRGGHHCAQPLMKELGLSACSRASIGLYNTLEDIEKLGVAIEKAVHFFIRRVSNL